MCLSSPKMPPPAPPPPRKEDANVLADRERLRRASAKGFSSTIMTSPLGAASTGSVATKTLLGG
jgi:hypothetical protein